MCDLTFDTLCHGLTVKDLHLVQIAPKSWIHHVWLGPTLDILDDDEGYSSTCQPAQRWPEKCDHSPHGFTVPVVSCHYQVLVLPYPYFPPHQHIELDPSGEPSCIMVSFHALGPHFLAIQLLSILNTRCHYRFHSHLLTIKVNRDLLVNFASTICGGIYSHGSDPARCPNNPSHSIDDAKQ